MRKVALSIVLALVFLANISFATIFAHTQNKSYRADTLYDDDLIIAGNYIRFESTVSGDLIGACQELVMSGIIDGNLNWASKSINLNGQTKGSVRAFAQTIDVNAPVGRNIIAFGQNINLGPSAEIARDAHLFGSKVIFEGKIGNRLKIDANEVVISGVVGGNLDIKGNNIEIMPNAIIEGNLNYKSPNEIKIPEGVQIKGETHWTKIEKDTEAKKFRAFAPIMFMLWMFLAFNFIFSFAVFIISLLLGNAATIPLVFLSLIAGGAVVLGLSKQRAVKSIEVARKRPLVALGLGFVSILLFPIASGLAILTLVGIPLGILIIFSFGIIMFAGSIYAATYVGSLICKFDKISKREPSIVCMIIGIIILGALSLVPVLGWFIDLAVAMIGFGALVMSLDIFSSKVASETIRHSNL